MKGHIRQRARHSWTIVIDAGKDPDTGKRQQQWHTIKGTKRDAQRILNEILVALEKGSYVRPSKLTLGEWLSQRLDGHVMMHTTPRTQESYRSIVNEHIKPALGTILLNQLRPEQIQRYYAKALASGRSDGKGGLSARSVLYHHRILSKALTQAVRMGILARNVASFVEPPRPARAKMATLSPDEIVRFLDAASETSYYTFFSTLLCTGLRRGELLALRWRNLDLDHAVLHVTETAFKLGNGEYVIKEPKTSHSRRSVLLPSSLVALLRQYRVDQDHLYYQLGETLTDDNYVFSQPDGMPLSPNAITLAFKRTIRKAGLSHIRVHDLRHTHATLMLKAGIHPKVVSERLGHASVSITLDTYSHVLPGLQEAAVEGRKSKPNVSKMLASQTNLASRPCRSRTCDTLIKSQVDNPFKNTNGSVNPEPLLHYHHLSLLSSRLSCAQYYS